ncbi:hypothetical protein KAR91_06795 [Candidatus Pacearchaeota archaeon]|nr:hypothetical protein [Candidatus Pacearchaeota archaeon]
MEYLENAKHLEDDISPCRLYGAPLAREVLKDFSQQYAPHGIPVERAEMYLANRNGVLSHGHSGETMLHRLQYFNMITINDGYVYLNDYEVEEQK